MNDEEFVKRLWWYTWRSFIWVVIVNAVAYIAITDYKLFDWGIFSVAALSALAHRILYCEESKE